MQALGVKRNVVDCWSQQVWSSRGDVGLKEKVGGWEDTQKAIGDLPAGYSYFLLVG